ncbi:MAG: hypothetical protein ACRDRG_21700 [Pseudonocardiaceae bacterium]
MALQAASRRARRPAELAVLVARPFTGPPLLRPSMPGTRCAVVTRGGCCGRDPYASAAVIAVLSCGGHRRLRRQRPGRAGTRFRSTHVRAVDNDGLEDAPGESVLLRLGGRRAGERPVLLRTASPQWITADTRNSMGNGHQGALRASWPINGLCLGIRHR